jgi:hypothetical protein
MQSRAHRKRATGRDRCSAFTTRSRSGRPVDSPYRARNLIERFFNKIKQCRWVATRYDKLAANYQTRSYPHLVACLMSPRRNQGSNRQCSLCSRKPSARSSLLRFLS